MADTSGEPAGSGPATESGQPSGPTGGQGRTGRQREPVTARGKTSIADAVVAKIVGMSAREVPGVHDMGGGTARAFGAMRERLPGGAGRSNVSQGVTVEVGEEQAAADLDLVVEYGVSIPDLAAGVRRNVIDAVEKMSGLEVTEVNVTIGDIHLPGEEEPEAEEARVQ